MAPGTILLVDDDPDHLSIVAAMLSNLPYTVVTAMSGKRALEMLQTDVPVLVITDVVMPDVSGSEIVRTIRADERLKETKIILMTSMLRYVTTQDEQFANKVLLKPMKKADLEAAVIEMLRRPDHQAK